jgi:hypothetical protein
MTQRTPDGSNPCSCDIQSDLDPTPPNISSWADPLVEVVDFASSHALAVDSHPTLELVDRYLRSRSILSRHPCAAVPHELLGRSTDYYTRLMAQRRYLVLRLLNSLLAVSF